MVDYAFVRLLLLCKLFMILSLLIFDHFSHWIQANCIDSTAEPAAVFAGEVKKMQAEKMKPQEQLTLEPYERDHAVVVGIYR